MLHGRELTGGDEFRPWLPTVSAEDIIELRVEVEIVSIKATGQFMLKDQQGSTH
jgi:hypothetical protein